MSRLLLETRHLQLLVAIADTGSLNRAARRLHLTPSALSQQLRDLEDRLGGPLFRRAWRRLEITPAGQSLTDAARGILADLERTENETRRLLAGRGGVVRIGTACYLSYRWFPDLMQAMAATCPEVEIDVVGAALDAPFTWLAERRVDAALVSGAEPPDPRVELSHLFVDEVIILVGRGHPWSGREMVEPDELAEEHYWGAVEVLQADRPLGRALAAAGGVMPRKVTAMPMSAGVPIEMARANLGITVMARWAAEGVLAGSDLWGVRVGKEGLWLDWFVATRAELPEPALEAFLLALRRHPPRAHSFHSPTVPDPDPVGAETYSAGDLLAEGGMIGAPPTADPRKYYIEGTPRIDR